MRERPIVFSSTTVQGILAGTKTQTRRVIKPEWWADLDPEDAEDRYHALCMCKYGAGDHLWVRETWGLCSYSDETHWLNDSIRGESAAELQEAWRTVHRADWGQNQEHCRWRPSIFMPRWASRITLELTEVRVQRLNDITEEDARAEGVTPIKGAGGAVYPSGQAYRNPGTHRHAFQKLWGEINGKRPGCAWSDNPWLWCLSFRRVQP